jgi:hypothetical protein
MANITRSEDGSLPAFAWPGGYQIIYVTADNAVLCPACANGKNGSDASETSDDPQWKLVACDLYQEGPVIQCEHCQADIASDYGDPDEPDTN